MMRFQRTEDGSVVNEITRQESFKIDQLVETQVIQSQPQPLQEMRLLGQNEDNRIFDSSCDGDTADINTQMLLTNSLSPEKRRSTGHALSSSDRFIADLGNGHQDTEAATQADIMNSPSDKDANIDMGPSNSIELTANPVLTKIDTPWINKVRDPFEDSQTPFLNKLKDPFDDTPIAVRTRKTPENTPILLKKTQSLSTPLPSAHKIFERLREDQDRSDLEVDTQMQSAPNLMFNTLIQSPTNGKDYSSGMGDNHDSDGKHKRMAHSFSKSHEFQETMDGFSATTQADYILPEGSRPLVEKGPANFENNDDTIDTVRIYDTISQGERDRDATQADIQVLGTAPDNSLSQHEDDAETAADESIADIDPGYISPENLNVVSDDENSNSLSEGSRDANQFSYMMMQDSISVYKEGILRNNDDIIAGVHHSDAEIDTQKKSQIVYSQPEIRKDDQSSNFNLNPPIRSKTTLGTSSLKEFHYPQDSQKDSGAEGISQANEIADVTQDMTDIDDESKVDNTIEEEEAIGNNDNTRRITANEDSVIIRRRNKRKQNNIVISPKPVKQSKVSEFHEDFTSTPLPPHHEIVQRPSDTAQSDILSFPLEPLLEETKQLTESDIVFKEFVWCQYNAHYYTGLIDGISEKGFIVKFADYPADFVNLVYPLDIRIGDQIVVNRSNYIVTGLECLKRSASEIIRCMRGYDTVIGNPLKKVKGKMTVTGKSEKFPMGVIKVDNDQWFRRERVGADMFVKPRRNILKDHSHILPTYQEELMMSTPQIPSQKPPIFEACLFIITGDVDKDELTQLIRSHGGTVVNDGFGSMVDLDTSDDCEPQVKAKDFLHKFKFAALISNNHNRKAKFLEALALGWPLLSELFVRNSVDDGYLKLDYLTTYLLPSGESKRLKFVKTHNIYKFLENFYQKLDLTQQLENNRLLEDRHVVLITSSPSIAKFIFVILGAKTVTTTSLSNDTNLVQTLSILPNTKSSPVILYQERTVSLKFEVSDDNKNKRSRKNNLPSETSRKGPVYVQMVDWEWVVQCLIDGCPWPSETRTFSDKK